MVSFSPWQVLRTVLCFAEVDQKPAHWTKHPVYVYNIYIFTFLIFFSIFDLFIFLLFFSIFTRLHGSGAQFFETAGSLKPQFHEGDTERPVRRNSGSAMESACAKNCVGQ